MNSTATDAQLHPYKVMVDKDVNAQIKDLQRRLVFLTFSGQRDSVVFNNIVTELNTIRADASKFYNSDD